VGGDTTRGPLTISVQVFGALPAGQAMLRSGATVGDGVFVSGSLGDAAAALAVYNGEWGPDIEHLEYLDQRFYRPQARLDLGRQLLGLATAAIDISDGLVADAGHIADASGVRICIDPTLLPLSPALASHPQRDTALRWALSGGDDYQLCFTLPPGEVAPAGCTRIGEVCEGAGVDCGKDFDDAGGYRHF
jgi:thiamine-monophosphate kinase